jgi:protein-S-isoprenylcysteine O-methyltransferase Ste14
LDGSAQWKGMMSRKVSCTRHGITPEVQRAIKWIVRSTIGIVVYGMLLFLPAGRLNWVWGWVFLGVLAALMAAHPLILTPINPELLVEREQVFWGKGAKTWDKWITTLAGALMPLPWIVAGLDVRFQWTAPMPLVYHLGGLLATLLGYALFLWAMAANAFFSNAVRIQAERGHVVATGGPYRVVRHPGYAGTILAQLATPFLLGSPWALIPSGVSAALFVLRTGLEDRTLMQELPGYTEYAQQTRSRLWPGVW